MRSFSLKTRVLSLAVVAALLGVMVLPVSVACCDCSALSEKGAADSCCCAGGCDPAPSGDGFFNAVGMGMPCDFHPVCCCGQDAERTPAPAAVAAVIPDDFRPRFDASIFQSAGPAAFVPDIPAFRARPCSLFYKHHTPTHPHIASTVLLI